MQQLSEAIFKNEFIGHFPGDKTGNRGPRQTPGVLYSKAIPTPVRQPQLLAWSEELAAELGLQKPEEAADVDILGGNLVTPSMYPYAACYAGHQFGNWAGQLGDGRAITLGELTAPSGQTWELQLKGAGPTPYSRRADGRAVLRSSVREYLMSEAMYHLGVPTTRALSLVSTGDKVMRDMFYDGNPEMEPGAIVMRVAPSFLRFGNFEMPAARGEVENLRKLTDWTIDRFYPHLQGEDRALAWYREVIERTAKLMVEWLRVGFVHGVMNTDNMSILGLTIDYGPFSFLDEYDPSFTPNTTDLPGRRYAFGRQAAVAQWNLGCLGGAIAPLFENTEVLVAELNHYEPIFRQAYNSMMAGKLGLDRAGEDDLPLIRETEQVLATLKPDMTLFYQQVMELDGADLDEEGALRHFGKTLYREPGKEDRELLQRWVARYNERVGRNSLSREASLQKMREHNPRFILRNYLLHQAIEELEEGKSDLFGELQQAIKDPYSRSFDHLVAPRPEWAGSKAGCSMLSCSS